jgi:hypothetical protein
MTNAAMKVISICLMYLFFASCLSEKDNAVLRSQLETSLNAETQTKLEEKIGAMTRMELELAAAQDALEKQSKVIGNMKKNSKSKKFASKNRSLPKKIVLNISL